MTGSVSSTDRGTSHRTEVELPPQPPRGHRMHRNVSEATHRAGVGHGHQRETDVSPQEGEATAPSRPALRAGNAGTSSGAAGGSQGSRQSADPLLNSVLTVPTQSPFARLPPPPILRLDTATEPGQGSSLGSLTVSRHDDPLRSQGSLASLLGSTHGSDPDEVDIESGDVPPVDKRRLGVTEVAAKIERADLINSVKTHALMLPMVQLNPETNIQFLRALFDLNSEINGTLAAARTVRTSDGSKRYLDVESGADITHLRTFKDKLETGFEKLKGSLTSLQQANDSFMEFKGREKSGTSTISDKVQRHFWGSELHAVFARSAAQSLLVVGVSAGIQVGTVEILKRFFQDNPDQIPKGVLDQVRSELGSSASQADVVTKAIEGLAKPGSTYLDENTSSTSAIYAAEAAVGAARGVIVPMADSKNESDARAAKVKDAIDNVNDPKPAKTAMERAKAAMSSAWSDQIKANMASGAMAAVISTGASGQTTGAAVLIEVAKTLGFSVLSAASNAGADGFRKAVYTGDSEAVTQGIKAGARIAGRTAAQALKTGISYAQSAAEGGLASRSVGSDVIKAAMQSVVSGGFKEAAGSVFQNWASNGLPPNEVAALEAGRAVGVIADFARDLNTVERPADLSAAGQRHLQDLNQYLGEALANVVDAAQLKFESVDFDASHRVYYRQLTSSAQASEAVQHRATF